MKTRIIQTLVLGACALTTQTASASTDHFLEFQMSSAKFAELVRGAFVAATRSFCPTVIPCPVGGGNCVLDRVEVGGPGTFSRAANANSIPINDFTTISAQPILYAQDVTFHVQTEACSNDPTCSSVTPYTLQAQFQLSEGDGEICLNPLDMTPTLPGLPMPPSDRCIGLSQQQLSEFVGSDDHTISGAAISVNNSGSRIALRFELDQTAADYDTARMTAWNAFMQGNITGSQTTDWSVFVHKSNFISILTDQVTEGLDSRSEISLNGGIATQWVGNGSSGATLNALVPTTVASSELPCPNDIDVDVLFAMDVAKNAASTGFTMNGALTMDPSNADANECALAYGPLGFLAAIPLIELGVLDDLVQHYVVPQITKEMSECPVSDNTFSCDAAMFPRPFQVGFGLVSSLSLAGVVGDSAGLTLNGAASSLPNHVYEADVTAYDVEFGLGSGCYASKCDYGGGLYATGTARFCSVQVIDNPSNVYTVDTANLGSNLPITVEVSVNPSLTQPVIDAFNANPEPVLIKFATSAGVRTYAVELDRILSPGEAGLECSIQKTNQFINCLTPEVNWQEPWEDWVCDPFRITERQVVMGFLDPRGHLIDSGVGFDPRIETTRDWRGNVTSAALVIDVVSAIGSGRQLLVPHSTPIAVPSSFRGTDAQIAQYFLAGTNTRQSVPSSLLPTSVSSADLEVRSSDPDLLRAVQVTMAR